MWYLPAAEPSSIHTSKKPRSIQRLRGFSRTHYRCFISSQTPRSCCDSSKKSCPRSSSLWQLDKDNLTPYNEGKITDRILQAYCLGTQTELVRGASPPSILPPSPSGLSAVLAPGQQKPQRRRGTENGGNDDGTMEDERRTRGNDGENEGTASQDLAQRGRVPDLAQDLLRAGHDPS